MDKQLQEGALATPTFVGENPDLTSALAQWQQVVQALTSLEYLVPANKKVILDAAGKIICDMCAAMDAEVAAQAASQAVVAPTPAVEVPAAVVAQPEVQVTYESKQPLTENSMVKRMRELAGIPHPNNRV